MWELGLTLTATGDSPVVVERADPADLRLTGAAWAAEWFASRWGAEFEPRRGSTSDGLVVETRAGRSSHGAHPWLGLTSPDFRAAIVVSPAWSGNWRIAVSADGHLVAGISPWRFALRLSPGERWSAPSVVVAVGVDLERASLALQRAVRDRVLARTPFTDAAPTEWNHWWPYEDVEVDEAVIADNARLAAAAGIEVVTVDAGWFGAPDGGPWTGIRGDWSSVNGARFPSGLSTLGDEIRRTGALAGMWIEPESVGRLARLRDDLPDAVALGDPAGRFEGSITVSLDPDDPTFLGCLCLGSPAARAHVAASLDRLVRETGARWVKLDFNVDPGAGCTRTDHGHGAGDGLLRHYEGLYDVLDAFRAEHPDVLLEACSSGGLRIDLGLARHVHAFFLSDLDHTGHHLRVLAGAARMLPPLGILHWSQSQWRGDHPDQQLDWAGLSAERFDAMLRAAMVHRFGVSLALPTLRAELHDRLARHVAVFRERIAPLLATAVLTVTASDEATVLHLAASGDRHAVVVLADPGRAVGPQQLRGLADDVRYRVIDPFAGTVRSALGAGLTTPESAEPSLVVVLHPEETPS